MIRTENLGKCFDDFWAVRDLNLQVQAGEILALLGPNGAGKTTTVRMLAALLRPSTGRAWIAGYEVTQAPDQVRAAVGVLTENHGLYTRMTGEEYLHFFGRLYRLDEASVRQRCDHWLRFFGLWNARHRRIGEYSKGMRQKLALARTLLHEPKVLLLDEPTSAMDPASALRVREAILALRSNDRAIVVCTHNLDEAERLADRIAIIHQGRIIAQGTQEELKRTILGPPTYAVFTATPLDGRPIRLPPEAELLTQSPYRLEYRIHGPAERVNPSVVQALIQQNIGIVRLEPVPQHLEQVYLEVVRGAEQTADPIAPST